MRAVVWQGRRRVEVQDVPDPVLREPNDAIVRITSTGICGSDLHLYEVMAPFMEPGDILGHEPIGVVEEVGAAVTNLSVGDRVVIPFNIACGHCFMCDQGSSHNARRPKCTNTAPARRSSGTRSCTGRSPAGKPRPARTAC